MDETPAADARSTGFVVSRIDATFTEGTHRKVYQLPSDATPSSEGQRQ